MSRHLSICRSGDEIGVRNFIHLVYVTDLIVVSRSGWMDGEGGYLESIYTGLFFMVEKSCRILAKGLPQIY